MDADGYPDENELKQISEWPVSDWRGLLEFTRELWNWTDMWRQSEDSLEMLTGGWSGNEDLVEALKKNAVFWLTAWESSRRGGKYVLDLKRLRKIAP